VSDKNDVDGASTDDAPLKPAPPKTPPPGPPGATPPHAAAQPSMWRRWGWPLLVAGLAAVGVLLAVADTAIYGPALNPYATFLIGPSEIKSVSHQTPDPKRIVRTRFPDRVAFAAPFGGLGPVSPLQALRAFLSNGAGLVLLALGVLLLFPNRARVAVERLESRHGPEVALVAGVATFLLVLGSVALLRFALIFLAVIPVVLFVVLGAALFGIACIGLAIGRLLQRRIGMGPAHPLLAALAGALVVFDLAVIPYAGAVALAAVAIAGLGVAVVTRFGSEAGWTFKDLDW
jgi:hypothetical protein